MPSHLPPRLLPNEPLPAYAFVPGQAPHPVSDPAGHSFGRVPDPLQGFDPERWRACRPYLRGCDLFNHGYCWEAHEAWEEVWNAAGRRGPVADFLKGLIKLAAAGVKVRQGQPEGVRHHARRAGELFRGLRAAGTTNFLGLALDDLIGWAEEVERQPPVATGGRVFAFALLPHR